MWSISKGNIVFNEKSRSGFDILFLNNITDEEKVNRVNLDFKLLSAYIKVQ